MLKKIAWEAFKNTGDINTFLEYKQISDIENSIKNMEEKNNQEKNIEIKIIKEDN